MNYKCVAFDLDGTLLDGRHIREASKQMILQAIAQGLQVILVSGRHHVAMRPYHAELGLTTPMISCNGAYLYDYAAQKFHHANPLSIEKARKILHCGRVMDAHMLIYAPDAMTYGQKNKHMEDFCRWTETVTETFRPRVYQMEPEQVLETAPFIWKFVFSHMDSMKLRPQVEQMECELDLSCEWSWVDRVDISEKGNSKGASLLTYLAEQGIDPQQVIAFGDNENDISMLEAVGLGVAMGNAEEIVKQRADRVIGDCHSDSIAVLLQEILD